MISFEGKKNCKEHRFHSGYDYYYFSIPVPYFKRKVEFVKKKNTSAHFSSYFSKSLNILLWELKDRVLLPSNVISIKNSNIVL